MSTVETLLFIGQEDASPELEFLSQYRVCSCSLDTDIEAMMYQDSISPQLVLIENQPYSDNLIDLLDTIENFISPEAIPFVLLLSSPEDTIDPKVAKLVVNIVQRDEPPTLFKSKMDVLIRSSEQFSDIKKRADSSKAMAFSVMAQNSKMGEIVQTLEKTFVCQDYENLGNIIIDALAVDGLECCIKFYVETGVFIVTKRADHEEEDRQIIESTRDEGRIVDREEKTIFHYEHVSLLINNMPLDDQESYGRIKDDVCILMNATESRVNSIETEVRSQNQRNKIEITCKILTKMIDDMLNTNDNVAEDLNKIIQDLQQDLHVDLISFNMHEYEEEAILGHLDSAFKKTSDLLDKKLEREKTHSNIMMKLLDALATEDRR